MTPTSDQPRHEDERHRLAFETYHALGSGRTYRQVADKLGVSVSTIKLWSRRFGWRDRIADREAQAARDFAEQGIEVTAAERDRDRKIVRMAKARLTKDIAEGRVKGRLPDLELLMRLESYLAGLDDNHLSWIDHETDPDKLRARLKEIMIATGTTTPEPTADDHADDDGTDSGADTTAVDQPGNQTNTDSNSRKEITDDHD